MISLLLLPSAVRLGDVAAGTLVAAHPNHADYVERPVGVAVDVAIVTISHDLPGGSLHGRHAAKPGEGGFAVQALRVAFEARTSRVAARCVPTAGRELSPGAASPIRRSSCASSSTISSEVAS